MNKQARKERGARARLAREAAGLSQTDFAELMGCSRQLVGSIEAGGNMSVGQLAVYVTHGRRSAEFIMFGAPDEEAPDGLNVAEQFARLDPWLRAKLWPLYQVFVRPRVTVEGDEAAPTSQF